jgi:chromosome segregation ATPase
MPLSAELEKLLALIPDEKDREARRKELTEMADNGLRQADYSRKMNELDAQRKANEQTHQKNTAWYERATKQYSSLEADLKSAQERAAALESAAAAGGGSLEDEDELQKQLKVARTEVSEAQKKMGELSSTVNNFNTMLSEGKLVTIDKFEEEINKRGDALGAALLDIIDLQDKHRKEYGVDLDRRALLEEAQKRGGNLTMAYEAVTAKSREDKMRKDIETEVEKRYVEKLKNSNMPYAPSGEPVIGPLQQRLQKKDTGIPDDVQADGTGRLSSLIGAELRAEGKA